MIYPLANKLKHAAINHPMCNMAAFGDIQLYDDKATIAYPYVNFDVVSSTVVNSIKTYTMRIYVCDRNEPYVAYNKCELILENIIKDLEIYKFTTRYFTLDFKDLVNGVYADFQIEVPLIGECDYNTLFNYNILLEEGSFMLLENGDFIRLNII